jgi:hypothetical protein
LRRSIKTLITVLLFSYKIELANKRQITSMPSVHSKFDQPLATLANPKQIEEFVARYDTEIGKVSGSINDPRDVRHMLEAARKETLDSGDVIGDTYIRLEATKRKWTEWGAS